MILPNDDNVQKYARLSAERESSCAIKKLFISALKVKVAHTWLQSVGFRSWSRFLAVSRQWVINPAVGCH